MDEAEQKAPDGKSLAETGKKIIELIRLAEDREKKWWDEAKEAEAAYTCGQEKDTSAPEFNIVHSNIETMVPAIYNSPGKPDIRPAHNNPDPAAKQICDIFERAIIALIDDNRMDIEMEAAAQDAFLAGRGVVRVRYDADVADEIVTRETILFENVSWRDYRRGPATRYNEVPWEAFRQTLSKQAVDEFEDKELVDAQKNGLEPNADGDIIVWEFWRKRDRKVIFVAEASQRVLKMVDDPLGLTGFFPSIKPIQPITATGNLTPVCPYSVYKSLAQELNDVTCRITALIGGLKARGIIAAGAGDIAKLSEANDNELITADNLESLVAAGGLDKAVMWWPITEQATVIRELITQRMEIKNAIYEVTGISDIIRGQSASSETATAQQIKTEWGSLRIKKMQRLMERAVRDLFVLCAEIISLKFSPETVSKLSGLQVPPEILGKPLDGFMIDVESDSTVRADRAKNREEMSAFLQGTAQFFQIMAPIAQQAKGAIEPVIEMYSAFARQFRLGKQGEDALERLADMARQAAANPQPDPNAEAMKAEQEMKAQQFQADTQAKQAELQIKAQESQAAMELKRGELQIKAQESQTKQAETMTKLQLDQAKLQVEARKLALEERRTAIEEARLQADQRMADDDMETKRAEVAEHLAERKDVMGEAVTEAVGTTIVAVSEQIANGNAMLAQMMADLKAGNEMVAASVAAALTAPKEIVKDAEGRPVGVRVVTNG